MLRELIGVFQSGDPQDEMSRDFRRMLALTHQMILTSGQVFFGEVPESEDLAAQLYRHDREVNGLEQSLRRRLFTHLTVSGTRTDVSFWLSLMSLVKDVERLGDYAKNLSQVRRITPAPLPVNGRMMELVAIRTAVERASAGLAPVFASSERVVAMRLIAEGRETARRCDRLVVDISRSTLNAGATSVLVLGTRHYKRLGGHVLNVLSGVVMPLEKLDYFDEVPDAVDLVPVRSS